MQRPTRILVFGIICLIFGGFIVLHNLGQLVVTVSGPDAIQPPPASSSAGQVAQVMHDTTLAMQEAMREPVYRLGVGLKSLLSLLMAGVLVAAGAGLLRRQIWAIRLAKIWSLYAILAAIAVTTLQAVYILPNIPASSAVPGAGAAMYISTGVMLVLLCVFPVLLLSVLPSRNVIAYLKHQTSGQTQPAPEPAATTPGSTPPSTPTPPPTISAADMTWRDDPWNDPNSQ